MHNCWKIVPFTFLNFLSFCLNSCAWWGQNILYFYLKCIPAVTSWVTFYCFMGISHSQIIVWNKVQEKMSVINTAAMLAVLALKAIPRSNRNPIAILWEPYIKPTVCFKWMLSICLIIYLPMHFFSHNVLSSEKGSNNSNVPKSIKIGRMFTTFSVQRTKNLNVFKW